jgi:hypothetical protein
LIDNDRDDKDGTVHKIMSEIYARGPVAGTINAEPIVKYTGGIFTDEGNSQRTNHIIPIVGWGTDSETGTKFWIIRSSWGKLSTLNITFLGRMASSKGKQQQAALTTLPLCTTSFRSILGRNGLHEAGSWQELVGN